MTEQQRPFTGQDRPGEPGPLPSTGATDEEEIQAAKVANRFDIRRLIGGLFIVYAVILIVLGIVGSHEVKTKAAGVNIDLWAGLGMLIFGILMLVWALSRPTAPSRRDPRTGLGRIRRAPGSLPRLQRIKPASAL